MFITLVITGNSHQVNSSNHLIQEANSKSYFSIDFNFPVKRRQTKTMFSERELNLEADNDPTARKALRLLCPNNHVVVTQRNSQAPLAPLLTLTLPLRCSVWFRFG